MKIILLTFMTACATTPAAPLANHVRATAADALIGTTWSFCEDGSSMPGGITSVTFERGGRVAWDSRCGDHACECGAASWTLSGTRLAFDCNQYTEYDVTVGGSQMSGAWHRLDGSPEHAPTCLSRLTP